MSNGSGSGLLQHLLSRLPPGENASSFLEGFFRSEFYPSVPDSFRVQLVICSVLLGINLALTLAALAVRTFRRLPLSPFRLIKTARGTFVAPQNQVSYCVTQSAWLVLAQVFIYKGNIETFVNGGSLEGVMLVKSLVWIPLWLCAVNEAWATAVTQALSHPESRGRLAFYRAPAFLNAFFLLLTVVGCVAIGAIFPQASNAYDRSFAAFSTIMANLEAGAAASNGTVSAEQLQFLEPLTATMISNIHGFTQWWMPGWALWATLAVLPLVIYVPTTLAHLRLLTRQIADLRRIDLEKTAASDASRPRGSDQSRANAEASARKNLTGAYWSLLCTSIVLLFITLTFAAQCVVNAAQPEWIAHTSEGVLFQALLGIYPITILGPFVSAIVLDRCLSAPSPRSSSMSRIKSQDSLKTSTISSHGFDFVVENGSETSTLSGSEAGEKSGFEPSERRGPSPPTIVPVRTWEMVDV